MKWRTYLIVIAAVYVALIFAINALVFVFGLPNSEEQVPKISPKVPLTLINRISKIVNNLKSSNASCTSKINSYVSSLLRVSYRASNVLLDSLFWRKIGEWVTVEKIHDINVDLTDVLSALEIGKIVKADVEKKGTQLKLSLILSGNQKVIFKPQWYNRSLTIKGNVYDGKDRHNAEIAGYHLSRLLKLPRAPIACGRKIDLTEEILPVATDTLLNTFVKKGNDICFYGKCYYCTKDDLVCGKGAILEGTIILWLPLNKKLIKHRNPWQRSYKDNVSARWEVDDLYCLKVMNDSNYSKQNYKKLLDLIETSIFDFLIGNGDRHHYEMFGDSPDSSILLLDNGKSFGNAYTDHVDILAPLYQCCKVRRKFFQTLKAFQGNCLGKSLDRIMSTDAIHPVLHSDHLKALDRRLNMVLSIIKDCFDRINVDGVLY